MNYLNKIIQELSFPLEAKKEILKAYSLIKNKNDIKKVLKQYKDENVDFTKLMHSWRKILDKYHIGLEIGDLLFCLLLCEKLEKLYQKHHLSHKLFIETMNDLRYKAVECKLVKKKWGLFVTPWYKNFFKLKLFALGRLEFEISTFIVNYRNLKIGDPCLSVHIPRNNQRLDINEVHKSIKRAKKFFKPYFKDYILFSCNSWLLYKKTLEFVSQNSNIYRFSKLFKIIANYPSPNNVELWRLFDEEVKNLNKLNADTSLRRKYLNYLKQGHKPGLGVGYFIYHF